VLQVLEHGVAMVRDRAARRGVALTLQCDGELGCVSADELKLKQVVLNLLTNAVKFTGEGGSVHVTARIAGDEAQIEVRDTGIGIADDEQERIFEAFQRGGRGVRTTTEGTGLGLTLSKRIVQLHGGRVWLESRLGEGSTFGFAIPVARAVARPDVAADHPVTTAVPGSDTRTVVVIDDDPTDLALVEAVLAPAGFAVVRASSGMEGVGLVRQRRPRVVLLDLLMPDMDGFAVVEMLRADAATADVPIVVLTHKEMTRAERDRLGDRIDHLGQKGAMDGAQLIALVGALANGEDGR
jgi:CheY-like chemotaxis protein/anti-sigma regulatory factor (Ser/Thr protein kinase)